MSLFLSFSSWKILQCFAWAALFFRALYGDAAFRLNRSKSTPKRWSPKLPVDFTTVEDSLVGVGPGRENWLIDCPIRFHGLRLCLLSTYLSGILCYCLSCQWCQKPKNSERTFSFTYVVAARGDRVIVIPLVELNYTLHIPCPSAYLETTLRPNSQPNRVSWK